ncbi:hypothetical protein GY31_08965 [Lysinibacillus sphaericus]|uniref:Uncharacterized protein n=1 Tax=Lysinibacillus sphaericus TaxID=1421 RepID=A0A2S5D0W9_LYSSH|nr:hypothetical protein [Lysinibacillus sphaericus]OEC02144.1 hypothetical protein GY31_08965 [Lysinibacillus sphaericus]POZ56704.1 hypothetical protein LYSIN_01487 [Lysinibacillus sphaericus]
MGKESNAVSSGESDLEFAVAKVLREMPDIAHKLQETTINSGVNLATVEESLDNRKVEFRLKVHNEMSHLKHDNAYLEKVAVEETERYIDALRIAKEIYGVSISQDEVNQYIATNVADIVLPEKERYAKALGISLYELDYSFDRDFYVMDTLWDKLMPVLMERYPQEDGEDSNLYLDRIKDEFYSHSLTR